MRFVFSLSFFVSLSCCAQFSLSPVNSNGSVKFQIKNFGLIIDGTFEGLQGKIVWDESDLANSSFDVSVNTSSVNTGISLRDKHLKKEDYFDAMKFPLIGFKSSKIISAKKPEVFEVRGELTIKGTTMTISFPFTHHQENGNHIFMGQFSINRRDYSVGNKSWSLSDNVTLFLNVKSMGGKEDN